MSTAINETRALEERIAELEAEVAAWRAAACAEEAYANSKAPTGSAAELALFQKLQSAIHRRATFRKAAIATGLNSK